MAYRMEGSGPALLLLHGIAGSSRTWRDVIPQLTNRFTVIAPDLMGHGESGKPVGDYSLGAFASGLRDLLEVLDIESVSVIGQSFGGGVAMQFAYQYPERCERLVLVDSGGLGREVNWMLKFMTLPGSEYVMPVIFPGFVRDWGDKLVQSLHQRGIGLGHVSEMWSAYASLAEAENRHAFARTIRSVIDPGGQTVSAMDRLYLTSKVPTLIIWGTATTSSRSATPTQPMRPSKGVASRSSRVSDIFPRLRHLSSSSRRSSNSSTRLHLQSITRQNENCCSKSGPSRLPRISPTYPVRPPQAWPNAWAVASPTGSLCCNRDVAVHAKCHPPTAGESNVLLRPRAVCGSDRS